MGPDGLPHPQPVTFRVENSRGNPIVGQTWPLELSKVNWPTGWSVPDADQKFKDPNVIGVGMASGGAMTFGGNQALDFGFRYAAAPVKGRPATAKLQVKAFFKNGPSQVFTYDASW